MITKMPTIIKLYRQTRNLLSHVSRQIKLREKKFERYKHDDGSDEIKDIFLTMSNHHYLQNMYRAWLKDKNSVHSSWNEFFQQIDSQKNNIKSTTSPENNIPTTESKMTKIDVKQREKGPEQQISMLPKTKGSSFDQSSSDNYINNTLDVDATIRAYQTRGHLIADLDPLGIQNPDSVKLQGTAKLPPTIVVREYLKGITEADMDKEFLLTKSTMIGGTKTSLPLREIIKRLNQIYCGHLGLEYTYIHDPIMLDWLRQKFEVPNAWKLSNEHRIWIWKNIMKAVTFEGFLQRKYSSEKRFGLGGCESVIAAMMQFLETSSEKGVETVMIGMAHRGRLNTLVNVCSKPLHQLFTQFNPVALDGFGSGDVKYHLGTYTEKLLERSKKKIHVSVMANPSHLEAIDPVVVGRIRAEQVNKKDFKSERSLALLIHGDAALAGQGVVFETMHLTNLPEYTTGGVIHIVINNQIGFTTDPRYSRSSWHCTDVARVINAPVFHVYGDDPDLVVYCSQVASEYRAIFHNDVMVDVVGYRRFGHNELDEPMLTQPIMYKKIKARPNVLTIYSDKLLKEGVITEAFAKEETEKYLDHCETEFKKAQSIQSIHMWDWHDVPWSEFFSNQSPKNKIPTSGIDLESIKMICKVLSTPPEGITAHNAVLRAMKKRREMITVNEIDWAMSEGLAFLSLLKEGHHVRLSGQDVERGTFSHRMHIIHDQNRDKLYKNLLNDAFSGQALYTVSNSPLSEYGVCGFELGYSTYNYNSLILWEAQFGDFVNTCQVTIDCILASGESKWGRQVGLVLLLPHGMEGQGPEHSSARLERFLQLCDDDNLQIPGTESNASGNELSEEIMTRQLFEINWIVCNLTTPANFFHVLRRQILMPFRKPLVIMTPKSLLRHPMAVSNFKDISPGTTFQPMIGDHSVKPEGIQKILFCSGKVYYDLVLERKEKQLEDKIAIIRIEQLCPFPYHLVRNEFTKYPKCKIMWFQEEHKNQGPYYYTRDRLALALRLRVEEIKYGGRAPSASPATGNKPIYVAEFQSMMKIAMNLD
ncbi:PREDICTED: 2-oxoglutarate dehydrogenase, mitochondrial-like [Polistes dominula]|uniref:2-oxoglutarate dehydrogenase, mitochondrial n=1 Tax=Polistes dominula TaxID=743375 RepID=A0ABM1HY17_POLDO|nr:PREDICTED: 2-oxoglutarate dehydrogenase, mitochondrial-like [Polistes dominula]